ncbi:MAG: UDP-N-acetylmuramoyl-L-alanyl-D-glutamate--2,6-diaminopimelate ligase [Nitrospina sp.]|nr:UDP-N-acetylmuramoyl-L-alanyl-D-glutamate--2,6-diaminopimelate ligase [Nitrospina sp.]MBT6716944.1 UDP-N-acetylmuramoyl-L-alanyl-D-glutamate--2,6-diaminopimelate ligase [Nitrospina sp.]
MSEKNLEKLIAGIEITSSIGNRNRQIENIAFDSRKVKPGGLFVAIPGEKHDGETFIREALGKGAVAVIVKSSSLASLQIDHENITVLGVKNSRESLAKISANYFGRPSKELSLTGITGTNGKTTLTYILESLSKADGKQAGVIGTIDCHFGEIKIPSAMTTPESLDLNQRLRQMVDAGISDCFLEVSSHALIQKRVYDMSFEAGIFTNLSRDHLDFHRSMEKYKNAKARLFRENTVRTPIVNIDDPAGRELVEELKNNVCSTGIKRSADFSAENIFLEAAGSRFTLKTPKGSIEVRTNLLGEHNIYNLISAAAWASARGMSLEAIKNTFQEIPAIPGRFESVNCGQNFSVLVDYAHTEDALSKSIAAAKTFTKGNVIVVFGCGGDRDKGKREGMGRIALEKADLAIITSDNPRTEDPDQIIADICKGIPAKASYTTITSRREAIGYAINQAKENDLILIAGKGHENYQILGEKKERFDDREVARDFLREQNH